MASKYIQKFPVPETFPEILHDLAKEILRNQPADILDFSALYFKCLQEGTVLDYANKGQNIPCDFKTEIPQISERPQRKKPLNDRDEALHAAAVENSANIAKKPMTPDLKLLQAEASNSDKGINNSNKEAENLVSGLKGEAAENNYASVRAIVNSEKSAGAASRKAGSRAAAEEKAASAVGDREIDGSVKGSRKSERPESKNSGKNTKEMAEISEKFLEDVLLKKTQEVRLGETHINANKENQIEEQAEKAEIAQAPAEADSQASNKLPEQASEKSESEPNPAEAKIEARIEEPKVEVIVEESKIEEELKAEVNVEAKIDDDNAEKTQVDAPVEEKAEVQQPADDDVVVQENPASAAEAL